ncbi:MAG: hypothetical protein AB8H12_22420, partial [Lewinella sp.]
EEGIRNQESGIRNQESGIRNQESGIRNQESGIRNQESGIRNQESGIRKENCHWQLKQIFAALFLREFAQRAKRAASCGSQSHITNSISNIA